MINQILTTLFDSMKFGLEAFLSIFSFYNQLSGLWQNVIAIALGISPLVIGIIIGLIKFLKICLR